MFELRNKLRNSGNGSGSLGHGNKTKLIFTIQQVPCLSKGMTVCPRGGDRPSVYGFQSSSDNTNIVLGGREMVGAFGGVGAPEERERPISRPTGYQISTHPLRRLNPNTYLRLGFWVNINDWLRSRIDIPRSLLPTELAKLL